MSEIIQWIITVAIVALAAVYLIRRIKTKTGSACCDQCDKCPLDPELKAKCSIRQKPKS